MFLNKISLIVNVLVVQQTVAQSMPYGMNWAFPNSVPNIALKGQDVPLWHMPSMPFTHMLGDDMQFTQMPGNRMPFSQTGSGVPFTQMLSNGMPVAQIPRNSIPFTQMASNGNAFNQILGKSMPFTQLLGNGMPIAQIPRNNIPFTQMPNNGMPFTQIPGKSMPYTQILGNSNGMAYTQMPGVNWNPLAYRRIFENDLQNFNNMNMPIFNTKHNINGISNFPLNTFQTLTLNNLIGNIPYDSIGFIDEVSHLAGISIPSTYTIIRNPYLKDMPVSSVFGNKFGIPFTNILPMTGTSRLDFMSNIVGGRNLLNLYF